MKVCNLKFPEICTLKNYNDCGATTDVTYKVTLTFLTDINIMNIILI